MKTFWGFMRERSIQRQRHSQHHPPLHRFPAFSDERVTLAEVIRRVVDEDLEKHFTAAKCIGFEAQALGFRFFGNMTRKVVPLPCSVE